MPRKKFIRLADRYRPIRYHDDYIALFDIATNNEFHLDKEQLQLIMQLDGTKSLSEILSGYDRSSRCHVRNFMKDLADSGLTEQTEEPRLRAFPKDWVEPYLEGLLLDVTSLCNLSCAHCYVSNFAAGKKGDDLSLDELLRVFDDLSAMNVRDVTVTGGEPLVRPDIRQIITGLVERSISVGSFFTNGLGVTEDFVDFLSAIPHPPRIYISLDGLTPATNALIRGSSHSPEQLFQGAIDAMRLFRSRGFRTVVNTCLHPHNLAEIPGMYELLKSLDINQWRMAVPKPIGKFEEGQTTLKPDWPAVLDMYEKLLDLHLADVRLTKDGPKWPLLLELEMLFRSDMLNKPVKLYRPDEVACFYHRHRCSLKANGDVISCGYFEHKVAGNVRQKSFREIWLSPAMQEIKMMKISEVPDCQDCEVLEVCGTGCRAIAQILRGDDRAKDDYCCAVVPEFHKRILPALLDKHKLVFEVTEANRYFSNEI